MKRPRAYCSVYGCMNSSIVKPELSFFKLPSDVERRTKWLHLISREDLMNKPPQNYAVCEEHFNTVDILPGRQRKKLKANSLPSLHLPDLEKLEIPTFTKTSTLVDRCVQTEETLLASDNTQTSKSLSSDTLKKRKPESDLLENTKKIKLEQTEDVPVEYERDAFLQLCDRFLTKELAELVKAQNHFKFNNTGNGNRQNYLMFCLNLYYTSPQAYRVLQNAICLPCPNELNKQGLPLTTKINDRLMSIFKIKVNSMTDMEKNCSVVIDAIKLRTNLLYNVKQDKIIGFQEIDGVQLQEPAKTALVLMVSGIFINWKQPVGFALLSEYRKPDEVAKWIDTLLEKLLEIGLNIRTFVSDMEFDLYNVAKNKSVTIERPYFLVKNRKIYYIFDAPNLVKLVRNDLIAYDFHFQNRVAKYKHIVQFYENDKNKSFKLARKLTDSHLCPSDSDRIKVCYATQLLSNSVATGISTYVDFNVIEESGRDTAELIKNMNNLFDALNSSNLKDNYEYRRGFSGEQSQITFFNEMLKFFQHLKLKDRENGKDVTLNVQFIEGFQVTIRSILLLFDDLKSEGCTFLPTSRLNQDELVICFAQLRTKNGLVTEPTSSQFITAYQKIFFSNLVKPSKADNNANDLEKLLMQTSALRQVKEEELLEDDQEVVSNNEEPDSNVNILSSEYNQLELPEKNSLFYVCAYLLKKCAERHNDCRILKSYIKPNQKVHNSSLEGHYLRYRDYMRQTNSSLLIVPSDQFLEYIEKIDAIFCQCFRREHINSEITAFIYKEIEEIDFLAPCDCFPMVYLKKLFIRMRMFHTVKFNNTAFCTSRWNRKRFTVCKLK